MRIHEVLMACGTVISILAAAPALPQQGTDRQPTNPTSPSTPSDRQPSTTDRQPSTRLPSTISQPGSSNIPSALKNTEGLWRVELTLNPEFFKGAGQSGMDRPPVDIGGQEKGRPSGTGGSGGQPSGSGGSGTQPGGSGGQSGQPGQSGQTGTSTISSGRSLTGYAETRLMLDDRVVQQSLAVPELQGSSSITPPGGNEPVRAIPPDTSDMFRALSLITFESGGRNYTCVFVDGKTGKVHQDTGTYEESGNRIVFNGMNAASKMIRSEQGISRTTPGQPGGQSGRPGGEPGVSGGQNVRVVLEVLGPDSHRVTMYQGSGSSTGITSTPSTPSSTPGRTDPSQPSGGDQGSQPGQPSTTTAMRDSMGTIIYRATYTKAQGAEASRVRQVLDLDDNRTTRVDDMGQDR